MSQLLHVNASPRGAASQSLAIAGAFLSAYKDRKPETKVDVLSVFEDSLPEFGTTAAAAKMAAFGGQEQTPEQVDVWTQARAVFDRFAAADEYVFNIPMWNAGVPYALKHWIDVVTQPGWVFGFDPAAGYSGLMTGRKAFVVYSSGVYADGVPQEFGVDFRSTFFKDWLRFVGITDVTEVHFDGNALNADPEAAFAAAKAQAEEHASTF
ncbi:MULTISPECIES: FMN-dependent NADH-azoreductase [Saccharothrix]|uniref:FMN-dependent NADH-azoreductase n=1 Tax=Saccharothrix TaxID=2071 RepID=UPI00093C47A7|nr:NAD(P)H-dependent oxidoreductase [Saccharothrix sp. CB00851]OKI26991.1 FMN-dependent NADH-azoreductase [Saccharothrix sp. CB00851]